jgi:3',5'-cyclic AMP phosphodiesterase CpdA
MITAIQVTCFLKSSSSYSSSSSSNVYDFEDTVIITLATARPDRDEGEVGHRQNLWLEKILSNEKYKEKKTIAKIVAMHHHLIAVPDTGTDRIVIVDAGDILRTCLQYKVDLVLCGHKHRPWLWNLEDLDIAYAGTASSARFRGFFKNTYNIIDIKDNGKVNVDIKIVGGRRFPLIDIVKNYYYSPVPET